MLATGERPGSSPKLVDGVLSPGVARRSTSVASAATAAEEEHEGLLTREPSGGGGAGGGGGAPTPGATVVSWKVYRTVALLSLTTMFVFADQNLMARHEAAHADQRACWRCHSRTRALVRVALSLLRRPT
jgi:hypothetical protein